MISTIIPIYLLLIMIILSATFPTNVYSKEGQTANNGREKSIGICCSWGEQIEDGKLTYTINGASQNIIKAVETAVEEWDSKLENLEIQEVKQNKSADIYIAFNRDWESLPV